MKKMIIGAIVGGLILFFWQFIAWGLTNLHYSNMQYTPNQDKVIAALSEHLTEDGTYFVPRATPDASMEEAEALGAKLVGKPWALVSYRTSYNMSMPMNMTRGLIINIVSICLLCWILLKIPDLDFMTAFLASLFVGLIGYFSISYIDSIWFEINSIPYLIDAVVQFGICGAWLGWWLPRK